MSGDAQLVRLLGEAGMASDMGGPYVGVYQTRTRTPRGYDYKFWLVAQGNDMDASERFFADHIECNEPLDLSPEAAKKPHASAGSRIRLR